MEQEKELKELTDHYNEQKKHLDAENKMLRAKIAELEDKNLENRIKLEKFHMATPELVKENELWRQKYADLDKDYRQKLKDLHDLKRNEDDQKVEHLKSNIQQNKNKENALLQEIYVLQQALQEKDKEINLLKSRLQSQNNFCEQLKNELNLKQQEIMILDKKIKDLINELYALREAEPAANEQRKKEFHDKIKELEEKITLMINENQRLTEIIKEKVKENEYLAKLLKEKLDENDHLKNLLAQTQNASVANFEALKNELERQKNKEIVSFFIENIFYLYY